MRQPPHRSMTPDPTAPSPNTESASGRRARPRWGGIALVALALAAQVIIASVALAEPQAARYGWQMYAAVPYIPPAWATSDGEELPFEPGKVIIHPRIEIDYVSLTRERGCELSGADAIRLELADGSQETMSCR